MSNHHPPIVILDFDGVILPSIGAKIALKQQIENKKFRWNKEELQKYQPIDLIRRVERIDSDKNWKMGYNIYSAFKDVLPNSFDRIRFLLSLQKNFRKAEYEFGEFYPFVIPTLTKLAENAIIGICTNSERKRILRWIAHYSISNLITAFTSRDDRKLYGVKPNPKILLYVVLKIKKAKKLGTIDKSRVFFVGDNVSDVLTAKNAGVNSVAVLSGHSTKVELENSNPDFLLPTLEDIFSIPDLSYNK